MSILAHVYKHSLVSFGCNPLSGFSCPLFIQFGVCLTHTFRFFNSQNSKNIPTPHKKGHPDIYSRSSYKMISFPFIEILCRWHIFNASNAFISNGRIYALVSSALLIRHKRIYLCVTIKNVIYFFFLHDFSPSHDDMRNIYI